MVILALDTSSREGSVALARGGTVVASAGGDPSRTHGERLPSDILQLLEAHDVALSEIELYAVSAGPGSFTGLRVGIATIQALALVHQRSIMAISTLDAVANAALEPEVAGSSTPDLVVAWLDGQRRDVFAALYEWIQPTSGLTGKSDRTSRAAVRPVAGPVVGEATRVLDAWEDQMCGRAVGFVGNAVVSTRTLLKLRFGDASCLMDSVPPLAPIIARLAGKRAQRGEAVAPHAVRPVYVRRPDAELAREQRRGVGANNELAK